MFAIGIFAHSLLLPFIGILVQVFVLGFCVKTPASLPSDVHSLQHTAQVGIKLPANEIKSAYFFADYLAVEEPSDQKLFDITALSADFPTFEAVFIGVLAHSLLSLRAPPVYS